ncbi:MAG: LysM domain-containing protein [Mycobacteriales bacterium]|nr:LysM domain-containing protein [Mycobacteriales bacterium]
MSNRLTALSVRALTAALPLATLGWAAAPTRVGAVLTDVAHGTPTAPDAAVVAAVAAVAYALAGWLLVVTVAVALAATGGRLGDAAHSAQRLVAPLAVRRAVALALGLAVVTGAAAPAAAEPGPAGDSPVSVSAAEGLDWPATPATPSTPTTRPALASPSASAVGQPVVVRPGDSLWQLAERDLTARSGRDVTDREVAATWPAWWSANRDAVGPDPDLLHPGAVLTPPAL